MALQPARIFELDRDLALVPQMAQIHHDCIINDYTMAKFLPPLHLPDIVAYWEAWALETPGNNRDSFVQTIQHETGEEVVGVVSLDMPVSQTGPFRCNVQKLLVSPNHRKKGIARALMQLLEETAKSKDRWLVKLDTTIGSGAEFVYPKLGYKELGIIPDYGFSPKDGKLLDEIFFYKDLRDPGYVPERSLA